MLTGLFCINENFFLFLCHILLVLYVYMVKTVINSKIFKI